MLKRKTEQFFKEFLKSIDIEVNGSLAAGSIISGCEYSLDNIAKRSIKNRLVSSLLTGFG